MMCSLFFCMLAQFYGLITLLHVFSIHVITTVVYVTWRFICNFQVSFWQLLTIHVLHLSENLAYL